MGSSKDSNSDGVKGLEAFLEVLVFLPLVLTCDNLGLILFTWIFPLAFRWVLEQALVGNPSPLDSPGGPILRGNVTLRFWVVVHLRLVCSTGFWRNHLYFSLMYGQAMSETGRSIRLYRSNLVWTTVQVPSKGIPRIWLAKYNSKFPQYFITIYL